MAKNTQKHAELVNILATTAKLLGEPTDTYPQRDARDSLEILRLWLKKNIKIPKPRGKKLRGRLLWTCSGRA
jgi:hypothetical protein